MKKIAFCAAALLSSITSFSQLNNYYPATGNVGFGTTSAVTSHYNLHVHGTTDYVEADRFGMNAINWGVTSRIGLTNTFTGFTARDGLSMRLSQSSFTMTNWENGEILFKTGNVSFSLSGSSGRAYMGNPMLTATYLGLMNYATDDNGIFIRTTQAGKYGLSIRSTALTDNAIQVTGTDGLINRFSVKANGNTEIITTSTTANDKLFVIKTSANNKLLQVTGDGILRSREIIVDAQVWADYVFEPTYKLRTLDEVKAYIAENGHLPNVPSTAEVAENGVNLARTDAILLEKIEELTLYMLQLKEQNQLLEERLKVLESSN